MIRASALRVLSSIRVPVIVPIMMLAIKVNGGETLVPIAIDAIGMGLGVICDHLYGSGRDL